MCKPFISFKDIGAPGSLISADIEEIILCDDRVVIVVSTNHNDTGGGDKQVLSTYYTPGALLSVFRALAHFVLITTHCSDENTEAQDVNQLTQSSDATR